MAFKLSTAQQQVVDHRGGPLQVIACAGSGKTESISRRVAALIAEGAEPASIVAFTFTEKAASELKERIVRRVEEAKGTEFLGRLGPMFVGTIHSYCFRILQDHVPQYGNYDVLDEHRHAGLLSREHRHLGLSRLGQKHWAPIRDFIRNVDVIGNELISLEQLDGTPLGECYFDYRQMLDRYHFLTFGLIISCAVDALENPVIFERVHGPLRNLVVDEYQDINPAQERLIELLARDPVELSVVGDDDQSIYQWRGSDVRNIIQFTKRRPTATTVELESNRRSRPQIIAAANTFAQSISGRLDKAMDPVRSIGAHEIVPWSAETEEDEARVIAETILHLKELGYHYRDVGVLYRSVRTSAPPLIEALGTHGIPINCAGRTGLMLQPEVAIFGEIFAWFVDGDWRDERFGETRPADLDNIVTTLDRFFTKDQPIAGLKKFLEDWRTYRLRGTRSVSLVGDFYKLLYFLGAHGIDADTPDGSARLGVFGRFSNVLADFEHVNRRARFVEDENGRRTFRSGRDRGKPYYQALANYLLHYARDAYEDFEGEQALDLDAVDVLTVHQAKGLEWPIVFIPALVSRRFPSSLSGRAQDWLLPDNLFPPAKRSRYEGSDAEERRLFYVAMTRARDAVYLSTFERRKNRFKPSPFLLEVAGDDPPRLDPLPLPDPPKQTEDDYQPALSTSFSEVALFEECGYRYRLASVLGYQQELAVELGYGKAIHHVLRRVAETARESGAVPDSAALAQLVTVELYLPFADTAAFDRMQQAASRLVGNYVSDYSSDLQRVWAVERPFELHLPDGTVAGRADVILDEEDGSVDSLAIVDYKVAHDTIRDERYRQQLAVYTAAGRGEGLNVEAAYLHELRDGTRHQVATDTATTEAAVSAISTGLANIRRGHFPATPEADKCTACDFRRVCSHCHDDVDLNF
ncbi:MAG: ATP-dependent helicase [bacterium]|nr:ATP-dependent helicase [bacterium]